MPENRNQNERTPDYPLREREYRDKEGDKHHHTNTYMEQHGKGSENPGKDRQGGDNR